MKIKLVFKAIWNCVKELLITFLILGGAIVGFIALVYCIGLLFDGVLWVLTQIFGAAALNALGEWIGNAALYIVAAMVGGAVLFMAGITVKNEYDILKQKEEEETNDGPSPWVQ